MGLSSPRALAPWLAPAARLGKDDSARVLHGGPLRDLRNRLIIIGDTHAPSARAKGSGIRDGWEVWGIVPGAGAAGRRAHARDRSGPHRGGVLEHGQGVPEARGYQGLPR